MIKSRSLVLAGLLLLVACTGETTSPQLPIPNAGEVGLYVYSDRLHDRGALLRISGPDLPASVEAARLETAAFASEGADGLHVAFFGDMSPRLLVTFVLPDTTRLDEYEVTVVEVARPDAGLLADLDAYEPIIAPLPH